MRIKRRQRCSVQGSLYQRHAQWSCPTGPPPPSEPDVGRDDLGAPWQQRVLRSSRFLGARIHTLS